MHDFIILYDIVIILALALPIIYIFKKIYIPALVGFLITGMVIGPHGFGLITGIDEIEIMAEVGVIFLLFTIGLEVSLSQLIKMKKIVFVGGGIQVLITALLSFLLFVSFGVDKNTAILFSMLISLSSTAIVLKILTDRDEINSPQGKLSVGILIFQDLIIVPMFIIVPMLAPDTKIGAEYLINKLGIAFGLLAAVVVFAKFLMPKIMYQLAKLRMREAFIIGIVFLILGTAYLTHSLGLSFALGAFIAGLILAESDYHSQIMADVIPFRDVFNSIFFVSVGLLLNIQFVIEHPIMIAGATIGILMFKAGIILLIVLAMKYPFRIALVTGLTLAQIGEFSFIIAQSAGSHNLLPPEQYNFFLAASIFTMILTPFLIKFSATLGFASQKLTISKTEIGSETAKKLTGHTIIAGFGLSGKNLAGVLKETGIPYVIVELNPDTVKTNKASGDKIVFGDISNEEILNYINIKSANILVIAISDPITSKSALRTARKLNPDLFIVVRTRFVSEIEALKNLGADAVIPEEFETSLEIFRRVLQKYHIPINVIMKQISILRGESYKFLRNSNYTNTDQILHLEEILAENLTETFYVRDDNPHINKTLIDLNLRAKTDATIIAIVRNGKTISNPPGKEKLCSRDTLVLTGIHQAIDDAINFLEG